MFCWITCMSVFCYMHDYVLLYAWLCLTACMFCFSVSHKKLNYDCTLAITKSAKNNLKNLEKKPYEMN